MRERTGDTRDLEVVGDKREQQRQKLNILLIYTLSVIVVCLTAFNFYLFCWIWSSLNGSNPIESSKQTTSNNLKNHNLQARLDLLSFWNTIKFNGRLSSKHLIQVDQLRASNKKLKIMSSKSVLLRNKQQTILELESKEKRINFPSGFSVRSNSKLEGNLGITKVEEDNELLVCSGEPETSCQIKVPFVSLTNSKGVDFLKRPIQTSKVETKRLHSAMNSLNLLSTKQSVFESTTDKVNIYALDELHFLSRFSSVSNI